VSSVKSVPARRIAGVFGRVDQSARGNDSSVGV
jgi:hypothetical protein